ncbi:glutaredoxin family protein [Polaromonas sp. CG_9.11]|uniref:glutaredoxin family protein n=1 Tax=Polaromonas sp. CG_9.11 TaxID=2787730 RepID=UPI0018CBA147|nr:glutaredoxin family protein [Polaromonas sp. CG_9.11]MBG6074415.1 glutaredoxin [Polaromonas sp. CG_9.11]
MKSSALCFSGCKALLALGLAAGALASLQVQAQQVYRIVGPDGKLTFSDRPPPAAAPHASISEANAYGGTSTPARAGLPFELRQVALKYPVVLYTGDNCLPCGAGRSLLTTRGVPFSEKTVTTVADTEALQRLSGEASLPFLTIGSQQLKGFSDAEWTQFLNAAGYPKSSVLLSGYQLPAPVPLVAGSPLPAPPPYGESKAPKAATKTPATRPVQAPADSSNPAGIKF